MKLNVYCCRQNIPLDHLIGIVVFLANRRNQIKRRLIISVLKTYVT